MPRPLSLTLLPPWLRVVLLFPLCVSEHFFILCFRVSRGLVCWAVAAVQDDIAEKVEEQPDDSSTENQQWLLCFLGANIPFDGFHQDAEHQGHGKNGVAEGSHHICPKKAIRALPVLPDTAGSQAKQAYDHGEDVGQHGESVRGQGQ